MADDQDEDRQGNEPSPLLLLAAGVVPLLVVAAWFLLG
jgi:hypothetical protein